MNINQVGFLVVYVVNGRLASNTLPHHSRPSPAFHGTSEINSISHFSKIKFGMQEGEQKMSAVYASETPVNIACHTQVRFRNAYILLLITHTVHTW